MTGRPMVGLCTDSNAQLPPELVDRYGVEVVPLTITVDDTDYLEGVDLDADAFYALFEGERRPTVSTSQPSPGQFALAYEALAERGCAEVLSIHVAASVSGTINAARLAAHAAPVPIRLVDTGTASFGVGCCVWAAGEALAAGASLDEAAAVAERLAPSIGNVFVVGALDLVRAGGRAGASVEAAAGAGGVPVLTLRDGQVEVVARVASVDDAVASMAGYAAGWGERVHVAVGIADREAEPLGRALEAAALAAPSVVDVVRYRVGPSVGAHTGPGTAGCFVFPA